MHWETWNSWASTNSIWVNPGNQGWARSEQGKDHCFGKKRIREDFFLNFFADPLNFTFYGIFLWNKLKQSSKPVILSLGILHCSHWCKLYYLFKIFMLLLLGEGSLGELYISLHWHQEVWFSLTDDMRLATSEQSFESYHIVSRGSWSWHESDKDCSFCLGPGVKMMWKRQPIMNWNFRGHLLR